MINNLPFYNDLNGKKLHTILFDYFLKKIVEHLNRAILYSYLFVIWRKKIEIG
jgi:hypothetical protein